MVIKKTEFFEPKKTMGGKRMKLFLISQDQNDDYETYDSAGGIG